MLSVFLTSASVGGPALLVRCRRCPPPLSMSSPAPGGSSAASEAAPQVRRRSGRRGRSRRRRQRRRLGRVAVVVAPVGYGLRVAPGPLAVLLPFAGPDALGVSAQGEVHVVAVAPDLAGHALPVLDVVADRGVEELDDVALPVGLERLVEERLHLRMSADHVDGKSAVVE
jgi:hypothetical protein